MVRMLLQEIEVPMRGCVSFSDELLTGQRKDPPRVPQAQSSWALIGKEEKSGAK